MHQSKLLAPRQRLLIACSGGADSVALLRLMHGINQSKFWQWKLIVAHINHGLRGAASLADQRLVQKAAKALGLSCVVRKVALKKRRTDHVSEATARKARYDALCQLARRHRCTAIVLAHHADDQAETVLLRILRGCSIAGLGAMRPRRRLASLYLVRPLLTFERSTLHSYLREIQQPWREDHTNASPQFFRNRIRLELLPLLQTYQPAIRRVLFRLAAQARQSDRAHRHDVVRSRAFRRFLKAKPPKGGTTSEIIFARAPLRLASNLMIGTLLRSAIRRLGGSLDRASFEPIVRAAAALKARSSGQQIQLGSGFTLHIQRDRAILRRAATAKRRRQRTPQRR